MYYDAVENQHGLPHDPFKSIVAPRPIGWIGTNSKDGVPNLAPYSFFNAFSDRPHIIGFSSSGYKDSVRNVDATGNFTCSFVSADLLEQMNVSSAAYDSGINEFDEAGLSVRESVAIAAPGVEGALAILECQHLETKHLTDLSGNFADSYLVLAQVVGIYIDDSCIVNGRFDITSARPAARLGYMDYAVVDDVFEMFRPKL